MLDDLIDALMRLMDKTEPGFTGPVNLGNPNEVTVGELAKTILEMTGSSSKLGFEQIPNDDPQRRKPDIALAKDVLDWQPTTDLKVGLSKTIQYFSDTLNLPVDIKI